MNLVRAKNISIGVDVNGITLKIEDIGYRMSPTTAKSLSTCLKVAYEDYGTNYKENKDSHASSVETIID